METIGNQAFYYANKGAQDVFTYYITIPETVTNIGAQAFTGYSEKEAGVSYFYRIRVLPKTPPIAENTGSDTQDGIFGRFVISFVDGIIVPKGCGDAYKTAQGWKDYADLIREEA